MTSKFAIAADSRTAAVSALPIPPRSRCCPRRPPSRPISELVPQFEKATGHKVTTVFTGTLDADKRLAAGETYDHAHHVERRSIDGHIKDGKVAAGSRVDLAKSGVAARRQGRRAEARHRLGRGAEEDDPGREIHRLFHRAERHLHRLRCSRSSASPTHVEAKAQADHDRRVRRHPHRQRRGRDRLPAGERTDRILPASITSGPLPEDGAALHHVLRAALSPGPSAGRRRQGAGRHSSPRRPPRQAFKKQGMEPG